MEIGSESTHFFGFHKIILLQNMVYLCRIPMRKSKKAMEEYRLTLFGE